MAELYLLVSIHFVLALAISFGVYVAFNELAENKQAEKLIEACEYRTIHLNAARLQEIINK